MSFAAALAAFAGCLVLTLACARLERTRRAAPPEGEYRPEWRPGFLGALKLLGFVGAYGFGLEALYLVRDPLGLWGQAAVSIAAGVAVFLGARRFDADRPDGRPWGLAFTLLFGAWAAWALFDALHFGLGPNQGYRISGSLVLLLFVAAVSTQSLVANWNDEDRLVEDFRPADGYIQRRRYLVPTRASAIAQTVFGVTAAAAALGWTGYTLWSRYAAPPPVLADLPEAAR